MTLPNNSSWQIRSTGTMDTSKHNQPKARYQLLQQSFDNSRTIPNFNPSSKHVSNFNNNFYNKHLFQANSNHESRYPPNIVRNQKYTAFTFLPIVFYEQFKFFFNLYFLLVALSHLVPALKIGGSPTSPISPFFLWHILQDSSSHISPLLPLFYVSQWEKKPTSTTNDISETEKQIPSDT